MVLLLLTSNSPHSDRITELLDLGQVKHCLIPPDLIQEFSASPHHPHRSLTAVVSIEEYKKSPKIFPSPEDIPTGEPSQLAYLF